MSKPSAFKRFKRAVVHHLILWVGAPLVAAMIRMLAASLRINVHGLERYRELAAGDRPLIFAFWHNDLVTIGLANLRVGRSKRPVATMISQSRDGEYLSRVGSLIHLKAIRGSSSSGAARGAAGMLRWMRSSEWNPCPHTSIAIDGPRGPRHVPKPGVLLIARRSNAWICPMRFECANAWVFKSWDGTVLPKPFSRMEIFFQPPIDATTMPEDADEALAMITSKLDE